MKIDKGWLIGVGLGLMVAVGGVVAGERDRDANAARAAVSSPEVADSPIVVTSDNGAMVIHPPLDPDEETFGYGWGRDDHGCPLSFPWDEDVGGCVMEITCSIDTRDRPFYVRIVSDVYSPEPFDGYNRETVDLGTFRLSP